MWLGVGRKERVNMRRKLSICSFFLFYFFICFDPSLRNADVLVGIRGNDC